MSINLPPKPKEPYWTPSRAIAAVGLSLFLVAVLAVGVMASPGYASWTTEDGSCEELAAHHYQEASKAGPDAQAHIYAAWAAEALQRAGEPCQAVS